MMSGHGMRVTGGGLVKSHAQAWKDVGRKSVSHLGTP
jgi:hypothetical protein